jgi:hypothetical protein
MLSPPFDFGKMSHKEEHLMNDKNLEELNRLKNILETELETETISLEESSAGKHLSELQKLRQEFDQYRAEQAAYQAAAEHREKVAERKGFFLGLVSGLVATVVGGLVIYYWPAITAWLFSLTQ